MRQYRTYNRVGIQEDRGDTVSEDILSQLGPPTQGHIHLRHVHTPLGPGSRRSKGIRHGNVYRRQSERWTRYDPAYRRTGCAVVLSNDTTSCRMRGDSFTSSAISLFPLERLVDEIFLTHDHRVRDVVGVDSIHIRAIHEQNTLELQAQLHWRRRHGER